MGLKVRYSLRARQEEIELLDYIMREFGKPKAKEVYLRIERIIKEIAEMPEMYRGSNKQKE